jgi:hypothetical protein
MRERERERESGDETGEEGRKGTESSVADSGNLEQNTNVSRVTWMEFLLRGYKLVGVRALVHGGRGDA